MEEIKVIPQELKQIPVQRTSIVPAKQEPVRKPKLKKSWKEKWRDRMDSIAAAIGWIWLGFFVGYAVAMVICFWAIGVIG